MCQAECRKRYKPLADFYTKESYQKYKTMPFFSIFTKYFVTSIIFKVNILTVSQF